MVKNYFLLFQDNLISALILPIYRGFAFYAILCFRSYYSIQLVLLFGVLGSSVGVLVNWYLGRITIFVRQSYHRVENKKKTSKILSNLLFCGVALFSWVPALGSSIQVLSGYFRLDLGIFSLMAILSNFFYLLYLITTV